MEPEITPFKPKDCFQFDCHPGVPCFNACCRDLNQFLTPYEILRLKRHLNMDSGSFLVRYTQSHMGPTTGLPIITLKPGPGNDHPCPFVSPQGCRVYEARPASCRIYPLMRGVQQDPRSGKLKVHYAMLKEPHCRGFAQQKTQSVAQWIRNQELETYTALNDPLAALIAKKRRRFPGPLDLRRSHLFRLALYDLDTFRDHIYTKGLLDHAAMDSQIMETARRDELALLKLGYDYVARALLGPVTPEVPVAKTGS